VKLRIEAMKALRLNYRWSGVRAWLKGRNCFSCGGKGKVVVCSLHIAPVLETGSGSFTQRLATCKRCGGDPVRGYQRIVSEPKHVIQEQHAIAEGVM
jgi:hypothetical protein